MPQFDFSHYPAQIFWFLICFAALYSFIAFVIIPRIRGIVGERKSAIDNDMADFEKLNGQISDILEKSNVATKDADTKYKEVIAKSVEASKEERVKYFDKFKDDSEKLLEKSKTQIDKIISESDSKIDGVTKEISDLVEKKILGI